MDFEFGFRQTFKIWLNLKDKVSHYLLAYMAEFITIWWTLNKSGCNKVLYTQYKVVLLLTCMFSRKSVGGTVITFLLLQSQHRAMQNHTTLRQNTSLQNRR